MCFSEWEWFTKKFDAVEASMQELKTKLKKTEENIMGQLEDLNTAIQAEDGQIVAMQASLVKVVADIDTLKAAIASGAPAADLTAQIQAIQSHVSSLTTANQQLVDADTKAKA